MDNASWDITTYHPAIRTAFGKLGRSPYSVETIHSGPYTNTTEQRIHRCLREFIHAHPDSFIDFVQAEITRSTPHDAGGGNGMRYHLDGRLAFSLRLEKALGEAKKMMSQLALETFSSFGSLGGSQVLSDLPSGPRVDTGRSNDENEDKDEDDDMYTAYEGSPTSQAYSTPSPFVRTEKYSVVETTSTKRRLEINTSPNAQKKRRSSEDRKMGPPISHVSSNRPSLIPTVSTTSVDTRSSDPSTTLVTPSTPLVPDFCYPDPEEPFTEPTSSDVDGIVHAFPKTRLETGVIPTSSATTVSWKLISLSEEDQRTVLVLPRCPYQAMLYKHDVKFHVQWELERALVRHPVLSWPDFEASDFDSLQGSVVEAAPLVRPLLDKVLARKSGTASASAEDTLLVQGPMGQRRLKMLHEIDREEASIRAGDLSGCGTGDDGWYGGKINYSITVKSASLRSEECVTLLSDSVQDLYHQRDILKTEGPMDDPENPMGITSITKPVTRFPFSMTLRQPDMQGKSFRLARRFGSRRVITFKIDVKEQDRNKLLSLFIGRVFVIFGRAYQALWAPADRDSVFAIETNHSVPSVTYSGRFTREPGMPTFAEILQRYNDVNLKPSQAVAKWAARPQILFSDSVPATTVSPEIIMVIDDIITAEADAVGHASTEQILTDGCGLMSEALASRMYAHADIRPSSGRSCVVQMRIGGAKGLLALMSYQQSIEFPNVDIVLRPSMIKAIPDPRFAHDVSLLTLDVIRCESLKISTTLSAEPIALLVHNGVPAWLFCDRLIQGLDDLKDAFTTQPLAGENREDVSVRIAANCYGRGGVGTERKKRLVVASGRSTRAAGITWESTLENDENEDGELPPLIHPSERYDVDPISGQSGSIAESLMDAVASGFHPSESGYTRSKLKWLVHSLSSKAIREFRIPVEQSMSAFIVPDSLSVLGPDEIFVSFSSIAPSDPVTGCRISYLEGPVLALRSPCKLPSDIRKFTAVYRPELVHLTDCIVMSARDDCRRSPASFLGGGDYDGDTVQIIWDPEIVGPFKNADDSFADTPQDFEKQNFVKDIVKGHEFLAALDGVSEETLVANYQSFLLAALKDDHLAGTYSDLHGNAGYKLGYDHPLTVRLARMFCLVLDARKSGLQVLPHIKAKDKREHSGALGWRLFKKDQENMENLIPIKRPQTLGPFVMDLLMEIGQRHRDEMMLSFPTEISPPSRKDYDHLSPFYHNVEGLSKSSPVMSEELDLLKQHIKACKTIWDSIRQRRLSRSINIHQTYLDLMSGRKITLMGSRSGFDSASKSNRSRSPIKGKPSETIEEDLLMLTQTRHLSAVWHDALTVSDVPNICLRDEESLKRLKISCASVVANGYPRPLLFPFDVDFPTTCRMKCLASGMTRTVLQAIYDNSKLSIPPRRLLDM
ncbi:hypothetical protein M231_06851 [Tremella mesenterica]|uniref:RNA-dependent RNA polymerase n=1 Tax=Tremella mesenterica TaxID=5217 RepID=A0A4Q1BCT5_TREME|nr:hypothetical protein M231_06851 [Tremella mesenterica]